MYPAFFNITGGAAARALAVALLLSGALTLPVAAQAASAIKSREVRAAGRLMVYERSLNPVIGITAGHAEGNAYVITDDHSRIVLSGTLRPGRTFYLSTARLAPGRYCFRLGDQMHYFIIR